MKIAKNNKSWPFGRISKTWQWLLLCFLDNSCIMFEEVSKRPCLEGTRDQVWRQILQDFASCPCRQRGRIRGLLNELTLDDICNIVLAILFCLSKSLSWPLWNAILRFVAWRTFIFLQQIHLTSTATAGTGRFCSQYSWRTISSTRKPYATKQT